MNYVSALTHSPLRLMDKNAELLCSECPDKLPDLTYIARTLTGRCPDKSPREDAPAETSAGGSNPCGRNAAKRRSPPETAFTAVPQNVSEIQNFGPHPPPAVVLLTSRDGT